MTELAKESFELNPELLSLIAKQFDIEQLVDRLAQAISGKKPEEIENITEEIFTTYGVDWIRKSRELGEEYSDRTYEVLKQAIVSTGGENRFPLLPQRVLEIAYDSTFKLELLPVLENNSKRLVYRIENCRMFQAIKEKCGEKVANTLPCRHACLSACRTIFSDLGYPEVLVDMEAFTNNDNYCQFVIART